ncbi:hypothetical protein PALU110988_29735 [Paenibacillus lupini]|nr:uncharacterized protein YnzC (UPF0291/DUF896 family) [Paenibacillus lupini]
MIPFLARINELSRKQAKLGLTDNEKVIAGKRISKMIG